MRAGTRFVPADSPAWLRGLFRPASMRAEDCRADALWLLGLCLALIGTGIGLRDPWPADEPRFALVARDMAALGDWLIPRVGGDLYADKPPLYFWLMAFWIELLGSVRAGFLIPSLLSASASVLLIYDLGRRLWNREVGFIAGLALLFTVQFVWQARQAQIDATLCFWTTLGLYGLLRHLLLGPHWRWYVVGCAAAGFGVITKGVGFLPLLVTIPFVLMRPGAWRPRFNGGWTAQWLLGPAAFAAAVFVWLVPLMVAAQSDTHLAAYRDEILFRQTVERYTSAWHHREPFWYFFVETIPWLWLPWTALLPWLVQRWRHAWRQRDLRITLPLIWVGLVVAFFSLSSGKRSVYVLPAVPALVLVCAPYLREIAARVAAQRTLFAVAALTAAVTALTIPYLLMSPGRRFELIETFAFDPLPPLIGLALILSAVCALAGPRRGFAAFAGVIAATLWIISFWVNPAMNDVRSGKDFIGRVEAAADPAAPLAFVGFKEQYLLQIRRPVVHFGHARWRDAGQEVRDAARWASESPDRQLVVQGVWLDSCFEGAERQSLGVANRSEWFLVRGAVDSPCAVQGSSSAALGYDPPLEPAPRSTATRGRKLSSGR